MILELSVPTPFSLSAVTRSHGWAGLAPFSRDPDSNGLAYVDRLATGGVVELVVQEGKTGVAVEIDSVLDESEQAEVRRKVAWMLGLEQDFSSFYGLAREEPKLAHVIERAQGRLLRSPTLFEDTVKTILTTNTAWSGTIRMVKQLVEGFGESLPGEPERHAFPTPGRLAATDEEGLRAAGLGYRAPYVLELARDVAEGGYDIEALKTTQASTSELRKQLLAIKGVGAYAAANLLMLLGRYDHVPVDSWARKVVSHEWYEGRPVGQAEVEAAFESWGAWKGLAYWFWDWSYRGEE